jgi:hypothetical protein
MKSFQSEVDKILAANCYFIKCKFEKNCKKTELSRKYITFLINKTLKKRYKEAKIPVY